MFTAATPPKDAKITIDAISMKIPLPATPLFIVKIISEHNREWMNPLIPP